MELITINAAYGTFQEDDKGSIKQGKFGDFVIMSGNPLTVTSDELLGIDVVATIVDGKEEYCNATSEDFCSDLGEKDEIDQTGHLIESIVSRTSIKVAWLIPLGLICLLICGKKPPL